MFHNQYLHVYWYQGNSIVLLRTTSNVHLFHIVISLFTDPIGESFNDLFTNILPDITSDIGNGFEVAFDTVIGGLGDVNLGNLGDIVVDLGSLVFDNFIGR